MKIFVTGRDGQLGHELMKRFASLGEIIGVDFKECDLTKPLAIETLLDRIKPEVIVNAAAFTDVDKAESEPKIAYAVNVQAPKLLASYASRNNIPIIHFSSDYVFDGIKNSPYLEEDKANPISVYGKTKWLGEEAVRKIAKKHIIIRTSWLFGSHGMNFIKKTLNIAKKMNKFDVVCDQFGAPTSASLLAEATTQIIYELSKSDFYQKYGTYHVVASGRTNWYEYSKWILQKANQLGYKTKITADKIKPILTKDCLMSAPRPMNSQLDSSKFVKTFSIHLPKWQDDAEEVLADLLTR